MSPVMVDVLKVLAGIVVALIGWQGKRYTDRISASTAVKASEGELELKWVQELRAEIADLKVHMHKLEERLDQKEAVVITLGDFLNELSSFVHYGRRGKYPTPPEVGAEHYNRPRWLAIKALHDKKLEEA